MSNSKKFPIDINDLPFNEAIKLYNEMRQAYLDDDQNKLTIMKQQYPSMFESETAELLRDTKEILVKMDKEKRETNKSKSSKKRTEHINH